MIVTRFMDLFVEATACLTDGQYYALILILSLGFGCVVAYVCDCLQDRWLERHPKQPAEKPLRQQDPSFWDAA